MLKSTYSVDAHTVLSSEIRNLLADLGKGKVDAVAYDTAWVARLSPYYPGYGFDTALDWLRQHQHDDGTWGAPQVHHHDRFISTLAAIVALREVGSHPRDERRVRRGEDALWRLVGRLGRDDSDTVGFPALSMALADEAANLGLDVPRAPVRYAEAYKRKINKLLSQSTRNWRASTLTFSLEALRHSVNGDEDVLQDNHSVMISPAATAGYLMHHHNDGALAYLASAIDDTGEGASPAFSAINIFEILWSLSRLHSAGAIDPDIPDVRRLLEILWARWSPEKGISYSTDFPIEDVDDTAACIALLKWGGYPVDPEVFAHYEADDHFVTYHGETNPSPSSHLRIVGALRAFPDHPKTRGWLEKALGALHRLDENGSFWWDKWHVSPYYASNQAIAALRNIDDDLARSRLKWILKTQNDDGGWGYMGASTPEETAYCLDALVEWNDNVETVDSDIMKEAALFLDAHAAANRYMPMWISKGLYTPHYIVQASILGARYKFKNRVQLWRHKSLIT
ncbi:MAG: hypothetical protein CL610_30295 [Anaerolineaceae bacterium]|nr:hypothetical protein [Anaerolineaceae bacterium]